MIFNRGLKNRVAELEKQLAIQDERRLTFADIEELSELFGIRPSIAGPRVDGDSSWRCSAVFACVRLIAGAIASLPLTVYGKTADGRVEAPDHPLAEMLRLSPNPVLTAMVFWECAVSHILLWGNSYSLIGRNRGGQALDLTPIHPRRVEVEEKDGRLIYNVVLENGFYAAFDQDDILHIPNVGWDGKKGLSTISAALQPVGLALAAEEHTARFFSQGAQSSIALKYPNKLSPDAVTRIKEYWQRRNAGLENAHTPIILTEGGDVSQLTMTAEDAQLIESRNFQVIDIARFFGVPPHMIGEMSKTTSWGTGIEGMSTGFVMYTLRPHLVRIEQELERKLFRGGKKHYAKFKHQALLRGDIKTRHESYRIARGSMQEPGYMTTNEIRRLENLPPVPGGDELMKPTGPADNGGKNEKQA